MSTAQQTYHGRMQGIQDELVHRRQSEFLSFARYHLQIPEKTIQSAMKTAELSEDAKFEIIQDSYKQDRTKFLQRNYRFVHNVITNVQPNGTPPDYLPAQCVYKIIKDQTRSKKSWMRYVTEELMIEVDKITVDLSEKILSDEQKYSLLHQWGRNGASADGFEDELTRRYEEFLAEMEVDLAHNSSEEED